MQCHCGKQIVSCGCNIITFLCWDLGNSKPNEPFSDLPESVTTQEQFHCSHQT